MKEVHYFAIAAGILFGIWPLLMNRSGLSGLASAAAFSLFAAMTIVPVALMSGQLQKVTMGPCVWVALVAGVVGGVGVMLFNTMLSKASTNEVGLLCIMMMMVQLAVPATYHILKSGDISPKKIAGIAGAAIVVYLLS